MARRAGSGRVAGGWVVLGLGLTVLVVGVGVALARHDVHPKRLGPRDAAERERYDRLIQEAANRPIRFDVSLVQFPLSDLGVVTGNEGGKPYQVVDTEITTRIRSGAPTLTPDFANLPHPHSLDDFVRDVRSGRLRQVGNDLVALLVTQRTSGAPREIRLTADRLVPRRAYVYIFDPTDLTEFPTGNSFTRHDKTIKWTPQPNSAGALIPLYISHTLRDPHPKGYYFYSVGGFVTGSALVARHLVVVQPDGQTSELALKVALENPLALNTRPH